VLVRPGAEEARVEGRFLVDGEELVVARAVPRTGRSRAYMNGRLATAGELAELGQGLVDLHGQHAHQSLLAPRMQREALDRFGHIDLGPLEEARRRLAALEASLAALGGDERARARELDLLRYQLDELAAAGIDGPDEEERLESEEDALASAADDREAGSAAHRALLEDGGAADCVARALAACAGRRPFADLEVRLRAVAAEVAEAGADLRAATEAVVVDPERLDDVRARRRLLADLRRKYGERLSDVLSFEVQARARFADLEQHGERAQALEGERAEVEGVVEREAAAVGQARRQAAPVLAARVEEQLQSLAMAGARFEVTVEGPERPSERGEGPEQPSERGEGPERPSERGRGPGAGPGDQVTFLLGANRGEATLPVAKAASGGELARTMLALRLALGPSGPLSGVAGPSGPDGPGAETLVFDEVDAGVGGEAALAVGRALAALAEAGCASGGGGQVMVVTHLPQVAAFADHQVAVTKVEREGRTVAEARRLSEKERVVELSRMLSGQPASATARDHAEELLAAASRQRGRD
ncbi:MAG: hypothetical protein LC733_08870, partial [Actinobacteria bacterium]|nr:hypothetical protein [Actinomycetota bacterium]